jgi:multidrug transporter EmrE-like cation transporter
MAWIYLLVAGISEIAMTTAMRYIDWSLKPMPIIAFVSASALSFTTLIMASWTIPLGTAYAIWVGIGAIGTALVGILWYGEPTTTLRIIFLTLLIASIAGLKLVSD